MKLSHHIRPVPGTARQQWIAVICIDELEFCSPPSTPVRAAVVGQVVADAIEKHQPGPLRLPLPPPGPPRCRYPRGTE